MINSEVCVDSVAGVGAAVEGGADRVELCAALELGGLTPSAGLLQTAVDLLPTHVLIRPRAGNFCYDSSEINVMARDIEHAVDRGAAGIVVGALTPAGDVDSATMARLMSAAGDVPVTFHRAFDVTRDLLAAFDDLLELGLSWLLTSGGRPTAFEGADLIAELVRRSGGNLPVMAGSGITPANAAEVVRRTGVGHIHYSARTAVPTDREGQLVMGPLDGGPRYRTSAELVRATVTAVADLPHR